MVSLAVEVAHQLVVAPARPRTSRHPRHVGRVGERLLQLLLLLAIFGATVLKPHLNKL